MGCEPVTNTAMNGTRGYSSLQAWTVAGSVLKAVRMGHSVIHACRVQDVEERWIWRFAVAHPQYRYNLADAVESNTERDAANRAPKRRAPDSGVKHQAYLVMVRTFAPCPVCHAPAASPCHEIPRTDRKRTYTHRPRLPASRAAYKTWRALTKTHPEITAPMFHASTGGTL